MEEIKRAARFTSTLAFVVALANGANAVAQAPAPPDARTANADIRTSFHVRFVQQDTAYLDGGYTAGLIEGMKLVVRDAGAAGDGANGRARETVAELVIVGVAQTSAVAEIRGAKRAIVASDTAYLSDDDLQTLIDERALGATRKFPAIISFTEGADVLDVEAHADVPRPPLPSTNRARGRFGFDYLGFSSADSGAFQGRDVGVMFQGDVTQIGGSNWTLSGYWRGRLNTTSSESQPTLQDLINRTYHLSLTYDPPKGGVVAGVGRLYLPWAASLETLDGGYFGVRLLENVTAGVFGGSSPDPTSYSYNPDLERGGSFVNVQVGSYDTVRYSGTAGLAADFLKWQLDRPFVFVENSLNVNRTFSVYHALQADRPSSNPAVAAPDAGIARSFLTVHWSPAARIQLDANHTYFRSMPTFDPELIGTGLLDKYLFQGYSGGARVEILKGFSAYTELGRSARTGDTADALNEMYGISLTRVPLVGRVDAHTSTFSSAFGTGTYQALSVSRRFGEKYQFDLLAGNQTFASTSAANQSSRFLTTTIDASLAGSLFVNGGVTIYRGALQNYDQWLLTFGYRFDTRRRQP